MNKYDVIIIGGACAGLSAAIYTARRELKTVVLTKDVGGQLAITADVENYPGFVSIKGPELALKFKEQAEKSGAEIKYAEVAEIQKKDSGYIVKTKDEEFETVAIILAFGLKQRQLGVPGEKELIGKGVAYCATCDGPLFRGKNVAVVGGGNSAFDAAEYLSTLAKKVYLFARRDVYRAEDVVVDAVKARSNIEIMNFTEVGAFIGQQKLEKVQLINNQTKGKSELELDGVFIEIGWESQLKKIAGLENLVEANERGFVIVDNDAKTSAPGIFAAGDVTNTPFKQAVISAGDGARAAMSAAVYIQRARGKEIGDAFVDRAKRR